MLGSKKVIAGRLSLDLLFAYRISYFAGCAIGTAYSSYQLKRHNMPMYFKCALFSHISHLFSSLIFLAISTDPNWTHIFNLGEFGIIAAEYFIIVANKKFIPREYEENSKKISIAGIVAALATLALYGIATFYNHETEYVICNIVNALPMMICTYSCCEVVENQFNNPFKKGIKMFNILYVIPLYLSAVLQISFSNLNMTLVYIALFASIISEFLIYASSLLFLQKGLKPWAM